MEYLINNGNLKMLYNTMYSKKKERFELILEPLQAILQLALLSFCSKGTKITINKNILQLQMPYYMQGILRWYQNDNKEDLFYLFYVFKRFTLFYQHLKNIKYNEHNLYDIIIHCAKGGLNNLIETYSNSEKISILHTLELYKLLLNNKQFELDTGETQLNNEDLDKMYNSIELEKEVLERQALDKQTHNYKNKKQKKSQYEHSKYNMNNYDSIIGNKNDNANIDSIFIKITKLYSNNEYNIILNTLLLLINNNEIDVSGREKIIYGLNEILYGTTNKINKWIHKNIIF